MNKNLLLLLSLNLLLASCSPKRYIKKENPDLFSQYEMEQVDFSFRTISGLYTINAEEVPWSTALPVTESNGPVVYYFLDGEPIHLESAQIRIEYVSQTLPGAETVSNLFHWLKGMFVNDDRQGKVISDKKTITTGDGQTVKILEIHTPKTTSGQGEEATVRPPKQMAWAYIPQNGYFIGFACSAYDMKKFTEVKKRFYALLMTYKTE